MHRSTCVIYRKEKLNKSNHIAAYFMCFLEKKSLYFVTCENHDKKKTNLSE